MAETDAPNLHLQQVYTGPDGNLARYTSEEIDIPNAMPVADLIFVAELPRGMDIQEVKLITTDVAAAGDALNVGTRQKGNGTWVDDEDAFIGAAGAIAALGVVSSLDVGRKPLFIDQPNVFLTLKPVNVVGAAGKVIVMIDYFWRGI